MTACSNRCLNECEKLVAPSELYFNHMWKYACGSRVVVLIKSIRPCCGDGSHYKLLDSYPLQQDLELEALTWTVRHLRTSASPFHICTDEVLLLNATTILNIKNKNLHSAKVSFVIWMRFVLKVQFAFAFRLFYTSKCDFFKRLSSSFWNKTVEIHLLHRMHVVIHKLEMRP